MVQWQWWNYNLPWRCWTGGLCHGSSRMSMRFQQIEKEDMSGRFVFVCAWRFGSCAIDELFKWETVHGPVWCGCMSGDTCFPTFPVMSCCHTLLSNVGPASQTALRPWSTPCVPWTLPHYVGLMYILCSYVPRSCLCLTADLVAWYCIVRVYTHHLS